MRRTTRGMSSRRARETCNLDAPWRCGLRGESRPRPARRRPSNELLGLACPLPVCSRPRREVTHCGGERIGRPGRYDVTIDTSLDEVVGGGNLVRRDHGQSVAEAFVHDEPPWLVEGGNDERIDLRVKRGKILAVDVAEEPDATSLRRRSGCGLAKRPVTGNPQLAPRETGECLQQDLQALPLDQPPDEEEPCLGRTPRPRALRHPVGNERGNRRHGDAILVDPHRHEVAHMPGAVRQAGVRGAHEATHPGVGHPPRPGRLLPVKAAPPGHERPASPPARREGGDVGRGRPDAAPARNDDVRPELRERPERSLRYVEIGVEARAEAGSRSEPREVERPGIEEHVVEGEIALGLPPPVTLHRRLGDHQELAFVASRDPLEEGLRVRGNHVDDHSETQRPSRWQTRCHRPSFRVRRRHVRGPTAARPSSPSHPRRAFGLIR